MIRLDNLSKYYHNEGNVVLGLRKINLELKIGEFVAITGESGSGKSTLLNVISGLDTYEDGELYINNEETSYYDETDWENYRRNYIGFVFQNYNLIDSYSVLENVETALIISGASREERRKKAIEILNKVGLGKHLKHKGTKLSGGEKQRLAIARAIAKDAPIIVADEPTGNLDSKTGEQIIELLHEISKEKLVIIVTHNYALVEKYVTRKIRIYDGELVENLEFKKPVVSDEIKLTSKETSHYKKALIFTGLNLKNQPKRTFFMLLVTLVTTFIISIVFGQILIAGINADSSYGNFNTFFPHATPDRIVVKRVDEKPITIEEYNKIKALSNVKMVVKEDTVLDLAGIVQSDYIYHYFASGGISPVSRITKDDLIEGRLPENDNQVVITYNYSEIPIPHNSTLYLESRQYYTTFEFQDVEVVGMVSERYPQEVYVTDAMLQKINNSYNYFKENNKITFKFPEELMRTPFTLERLTLVPDISVKDDEVMVLVQYLFDMDISEIDVKAVINDGVKEYKVKVSDKTNSFIYNDSTIRVSPKVYDELVKKVDTYYQHTVYVKNVSDIDKTIDTLRGMGYYAFCPYKTGINRYFDIGILIGEVAVILFSALVMFCIYLLSFLVIKTILNSKRRDYAILRSVGLDAKAIKTTIIMEIVISFVIAFIILFIAIMAIKAKPIKDMYNTYHWYDYIILFFINIIIGYLTSLRYNRKMIEKSLVAQAKVE